MTLLHYFTPRDIAHIMRPTVLENPFSFLPPHPLAEKASQLLQEKLATNGSWQQQFWMQNGGKMFAVLVVADDKQHLGYLAGFDGQLFAEWLQLVLYTRLFGLSNWI